MNAVHFLNVPLLLGSLSFGILSFVLPIYSKNMGASALEIGGLFTVFSAIVLIIRPVVGRAIDRYGLDDKRVVEIFFSTTLLKLGSNSGH